MTSNFENIIRKVFRHLLPKETVEYNIRPNWLKYKTGNNLEIDIFFPRIKLAIEVNGFTHDHNFQKERDIFKWKQCKKQRIFLLNINNLSDLFNTKIRKIVLDRFKIDLSRLNAEIMQEIADYKPKKIPNLANKIISKAKKFKMIQRYNEAQNKEKGYVITR